MLEGAPRHGGDHCGLLAVKKKMKKMKKMKKNEKKMKNEK